MPEPAVDNEEKEGDEEKSKVPKGITPVFLSSATQQIFHCEADVDVTDEKTHILLSKKNLLEDIHNRAAVSDFQPLKKIIKVSRCVCVCWLRCSYSFSALYSSELSW